MTAVLKVRAAGPFVSVQDAGRCGFKRFGVTGSGAMDRFSFELANRAIQQNPANASIEISLGGIELECVSGSVSAALAGGSFTNQLDGQRLPSCSFITLQTGSVLRVRPGAWGSWCYLAFAGTLRAPAWLGSQSVHLDSGLCGRPLAANDLITIDQPITNSQFSGVFASADQFRPDSLLRVVSGPQDHHFDPASVNAFFSTPFNITADYNRMGVRLSGITLKIPDALDIPSEPIARGSLQVPGHGDPILLMADHQSTGGYPKIATVISCDQDKFAQLRSGDTVHFKSVAVEHAIEATRQEHQKRQRVYELAVDNQVSFEQRLAQSNLISGVTDASGPGY